MIIDIDGQLMQAKEAVISVYDHGFLYGIGLFETFRTFRGKPFFLEEHLNRMQEAAVQLGIRINISAAELTVRATRLLDENHLNDAYFRLSVSAGTQPLGLPEGDYLSPVTILYCKPLPSYPKALEQEGKSLQLLRMRRNEPEGDVRWKSFHYMNNLLAKRELQNYPWASGAEGLLLDSKGRVAEGIVSNLFIIKSGLLRTPDTTTGILPGIIRKWVLDTAHHFQLPAEEGDVYWEELLLADEVFLTNSIQGIVPVSRLFTTEGEKKRVSTGKAGEGTKKLMSEYERYTGG